MAGAAVFMCAIWLLDWLARRRDRKAQHRSA
jgi:hypothetical protein